MTWQLDGGIFQVLYVFFLSFFTDSVWGGNVAGGKLPNTWEPIDAEMYAILAYL